MTELVSTDKIVEVVGREKLLEVTPCYAEPRQRNYTKMSISFVTKLMNLFFDIVLDKLMDSDRVILDKRIGTHLAPELYIGVVQKSHPRFLNTATDGKVYNIIMTGFTPPIIIRLNKKRRLELKERLESGQSFY